MVLVGLLRPTLFLILICFLRPCSSVSDSEALLQLKKSLKFKDPNILSSWNPATAPCKAEKNQWEYLMCDKAGGVMGLRLGSLGLAGDIDVVALQEMQALRTISFTGNTFEGPLPEFNRLGMLKSLYLSNNGFSGEIAPDFFLKMGSLKKLWMGHNKFTGSIPSSLAKLANLRELHIENNQFSGTLPPFPKGFYSFNASNNLLEGGVPESLSNFNATSFMGNEGLCGKPLDKECGGTPPAEVTPTEGVPPPAADGAKTPEGSALPAILVLVLVLLILMVATIVVVKRRREFDILERESFAEPAEMHVPPPASSIKEMETPSASSRGVASSRKGSQHGGGKGAGAGDLVVVNDEKGIFGLPDLMKAAAEVLGNGSLGSAYKAVMTNGVAVAVKRMRDMNKVAKDGFDMELRRLGALHHRNILTPLAYHYRKEEKLVVYEYIPRGSLLFLLHGDRGSCQGELDWPTRLKIIHGIARGMAFLHTELASYDLPHGNLKSSNIFLSSDYEPLLSDYGFWSVVNPAQATQSMFAFKAPEATEYQLASPKCDVYCFGIVILEILTGKFPSQYLHNGTGGTDVVQWVLSALLEGKETELFDPEIASATESFNEMEQLLYIGAALVETNPEKRPTMKEAVRKIEEIQVGQGRAPTLKEEYAKLSSSPNQ